MAVIDDLDPLFDEISRLLGELAGNEAVHRMLESEAQREPTEGWTQELLTFTVPGTYGFEKVTNIVLMSHHHPDWYDSPVKNSDRIELWQDAIDQLWRDNVAQWTIGTLPILYRSASQDVWEPDPATLSAPVESLGDLTRWLNNQLRPGAGWSSPDNPNAPEWLTQLRAHWPATTESPQSFYAFWDDVNEKCGLYLHAAARLASTAAQVATALSDFQANLLEATRLTRDRAREALQQWQEWKDDSGAWPTGAMRDNSGLQTILGNVSYVSGLVALWPPASIPAGGISLVTGTLTYVVPDQTQVMESLQAATASAIHSGFMNDLATITTTLKDVLDGIRTQPLDDGSTTGSLGFQTYVADVVGNHRDWTPPEVVL